MTNDVVLIQSAFEVRGPVGFAVAYIKGRHTVPVVGLATVDFGTDHEDRVELRAARQAQGSAARGGSLSMTVDNPRKDDRSLLVFGSGVGSGWVALGR